MPNSVRWDDIKPGVIIRYEHISRAKRLAGQRLTVRRGRVEKVYPPPQILDGQITLTVLNKDGSANASLGRISIHGLGFVLSVEPAPQATAATRPKPSDDHNCTPGCPTPCPQDDDDPRGWQG